MSRHNLLEMEQLQKGDRPKPRPRVTKASSSSYSRSPYHAGLDEILPSPPKPRTSRRKESDFDLESGGGGGEKDDRSMGSVSSGAGDRGRDQKSTHHHPHSSAYDNPIFLHSSSEEEDHSSSRERENRRRRRSRKGKEEGGGYSQEESPPTRDNQREEKEERRRRKEKGGGRGPYTSGDSAEEESYLVIENETGGGGGGGGSGRRRRRRLSSSPLIQSPTPSDDRRGVRRRGSLHSSQASTPTKTGSRQEKDKGKKESHVKIQMEQEEVEKVIPPSPAVLPLLKKPPLARIWDRIRGGSKQPPLPPPQHTPPQNKEKVDKVLIEMEEKVGKSKGRKQALKSSPTFTKKRDKERGGGGRGKVKGLRDVPLSDQTSPFSSEPEVDELEKVREIVSPTKSKSASDATFIVDTTDRRKQEKTSSSSKNRSETEKVDKEKVVGGPSTRVKPLSFGELKKRASKLGRRGDKSQDHTHSIDDIIHDDPRPGHSRSSTLLTQGQSGSPPLHQSPSGTSNSSSSIIDKPPDSTPSKRTRKSESRSKEMMKPFLSKIRKKSKSSPPPPTLHVLSPPKAKKPKKGHSSSPLHHGESGGNASDSDSESVSSQEEGGVLRPHHTPQGVDETFVLFGLTIHGSDILPLDPNVLHPLVKVTLLNSDGKQIPKRDPLWWVQDPSDDPKRKTKKPKHGRGSDPKRSSFLLPVMTQPFRFQFQSLSPVLTPAWDELLLWEEPFTPFLQENPNLIIFFEVMDFLPMGQSQGGQGPEGYNDGVHGSDLGWYKVAWAFLRPRRPSGDLNTESMLRLQLYKPIKLRRREVLPGPEVYSWWKCGRGEQLLNTTLYVTLKGVSPPALPTSSPSLGQLLSMRKEHLTDALLEAQFQSGHKNNNQRVTSASGGVKKRKKRLKGVDIRKGVTWSRYEGQSCKVPNTLLVSLPSSPIPSLSLTISGNVHALKFSPCGLKLAAGLDAEDLHAVLIFEIPSGALLRSLKNHQGLIYELCWKEVELGGGECFQFLASASADATANIWRMKNNDEGSLRLIQTLHHPSFVYSVQFHPTHPSLVVTGCFDFIIRIWDIDPPPPTAATPTRDGKKVKTGQGHRPRAHIANTCPIFILDRHCSFVNCLTFDPSGNTLYSGDGDSLLFKWQILSTPAKKKSWSIQREVRVREGGRIPINSLSLHPGGGRLLVHLRDNCLLIYDTDNLIPIKTIRGITNDRLQIRSTFSPCGNLILSGNESSSFCIWDGGTYEVADYVTPGGHPNCVVTSVDYHPLDFYVAIGLSSGISEPSPVLLYTHVPPTLSQVALVAGGVAKFKAPLKSKDRKKYVSWGSKRGSSSEKFSRILDTLDSALKASQRRVEDRVRGGGGHRSVGVDAATETPPAEKRKSATSGESGAGVKSPVGGVDKTLSRRDLSAPGEEGIMEGGQGKGEELPTKSPRTRIEERLEELILSPQKKDRQEEEVHIVDKPHPHKSRTILSDVHPPPNSEDGRGASEGEEDEFGGGGESEREKVQPELKKVGEIENIPLPKKRTDLESAPPTSSPGHKNSSPGHDPRPQSSKIPIRVTTAPLGESNQRENIISSSVPSSPKHF